MLRAYYGCSPCRQGPFPLDVSRDIEGSGLSPGVRRMLALGGRECSWCDPGRPQMELLADLEVTAQAVERVTEAWEPTSPATHRRPSGKPCNWNCPSR